MLIGLRQLPCVALRVLVFGALLLGLGMIFAGAAFAAPRAQAIAGDTRLVLTDEPCQIEAVTNLPYRAVWQEGGKEFDGCWVPHPQFPVVMFYFSDRTVVIVPREMFMPLTGM